MTETKQESETGKSGGAWARWWKETKTAFGNLPGTFRLVWEADARATVGMFFVTIAFALLPIGQAWTGKVIVDSILNTINTKAGVEAGFQAVLPFLLLEFFFLASFGALNQIRSLLEHIINAKLAHLIHTKIMRRAVTLDLHYFEDAAFYDKLQNAQREVNWRPLGVVNSSFLLMQDAITLLSAGVLLAAFGPLITLLLFAAVIPSFVAQLRYSKLYFRLLTWHAPEFRRKSYLEHLLTVDSGMKEIKLFGLGEPLLKRYDDMFRDFYNRDTRLAKRRTFIGSLWAMLVVASYYFAYGWMVFRTLNGEITLGDLTLYLMILRQSQGSFQGLFYSIGEIYEGSLFMSNLFGFLSIQPDIRETGTDSPSVPRPLRQGIEFRDVSFRYPGRADWALRHLNLHIAPGEKLALVGSNGAGKTTLVKLLTRLYDPTEGQILLDGRDLREYSLTDLRRRTGVIFQDFVQYQTTARENIGFGQIEAMDEQPRIERAAQRGGGDDVVTELPDGYETMLGRWFDNGHELSGGQWQKIALSRAFMRDGEILVLDEPTSALDAEREYEIFQRFRDLTEGKTALLISHRFSTVRMADRIAVLADGQILELGSHRELLDLGGTYAHLFNLQAEGYR
jgi:ATP-binding cassette, subfamily B, bacterial